MKSLLSGILVLFFFAPVFAQRPDVVVTTGHNDQVNTLDVSPNGHFLASGDNDKQIKIWELATGREFRTISGMDGRVNRIMFDHTGKLILGVTNDGNFHSWDVVTGEELGSHPVGSNATELEYLPSGKAVIIGEDSKVELIDPKFEEPPITLEIQYPTRLTTSRDGRRLFALTYDGKLNAYSLPDGNMTSSVELFKEGRYAVVNMEYSTNTNYLAIAFDQDKENVRIFDANTLEQIGTLSGHKIRISTMCFSPSGEQLITTDHSANVICWDVAKGKQLWQQKNTTFAPTAITFLPDAQSLLIAEMKDIHLVKVRTGKRLRTFNAVGNMVVNMAYDPTDRFVAIATADISIKLWELQQNRIASVVKGFFPVAFSPDGSYLVASSSAFELAVWDPYSGDKLYTLATDMELIQNLTFSDDGRYLAGSGFNGIGKIWDLESQTLIKRLTGHVGGIYSMDFSPDGTKIVTGGMDNTVRLWDWQAEKELAKGEQHQIIVNDVEFSPNGDVIASGSWDKSIVLWNAADLTMLRRLEGHTNMVISLSFSKDGTTLASGAGNNAVAEADNSVKIWDVATGKEICTPGTHRDLITNVSYSSSGTQIFTAGDDGMAIIWDAENCEEEVRMISVNDQDYVLVTPDNYYTASKDALSAVSFRVDDQLFPFDQFDLKLNRPDIVASRVGKAPLPLIDAYYKAYQKRLKKMKFSEEMLGDDFHLPEAKIVSEDLPVSTQEEEIKIKVKLFDERFKLDRANVFVNDVPVYGVEGIDLRGKGLQATELEIVAPLIPGANTVQISVLNEKGAESLRQTHQIIRETSTVIGDLHVIAVGVSNYKESRFKLDFAAKDARDFIKQLEGSAELYNEVHIKEITDSLATVENITALESYLANTAPEDVVIIFFAGHGMLSRDMEYFYGTYDIEFRNPLARGLSYTKIEALFNKTRALRKLLIMDTCHSGEVEDNDDDLDVKDDGSDGRRNVTTKTFGTRGNPAAPGSAAASVGLYNSYELMQSLFSDIRRGTGATVISSAGGAEYAYESTEWSNGLFTFCMLDGLQTGKADLNRDGKILISELRSYVNGRVSDLSDGKQNPTYRNENLSMDFTVWKLR